MKMSPLFFLFFGLLILPTSALSLSDDSSFVFTKGVSGVVKTDDEVPFFLVDFRSSETDEIYSIFEFQGKKWVTPANGAYTYYPAKEEGPLTLKEIWSSLLTDDSKPNYELNIWYHEDGTIDFSKSLFAIVPAGYENGREVTFQKNGLNEDFSRKVETVTQRKLNVCFDYSTDPHVKTGLCEYFSLEKRSDISAVEPEKMAYYLDSFISKKGVPEEAKEVSSAIVKEKPNIFAAFFTVPSFFDNFTAGFPGSNWSAADLDTSGVPAADYWDEVSNNYYSGPYSIWSAKFGNQSDGGQSNYSVSRYDDLMQSYARVTFNSTGIQNARITYAFWLSMEDNISGGLPYDLLRVQFKIANGPWQNLKEYAYGYDGGDSPPDPLSRMWDVDSSILPVSFTASTIQYRFLFISDNSVHSRQGAYIDDVYIDGLLEYGFVCSSNSECLSNVCGGAHNAYFINCNIDGSSTVYGDLVQYQNTCGGNGGHPQTIENYTNATCSSGRVCDADLSYESSTFSTGTICKKNINQSCSSNSECWNDNGGVDCMGSGARICTYGNNGDYCADGSQCDSGQCFSNQCSSGIPNGQACTTDLSCASDLCVGGFCQAQVAYSPILSSTDSWDSTNSGGHSTSNDALVFLNGTVYPKVAGLREETDMLCYDFDRNGVYDVCYYDTNGCGGNCNANSCNSFTIPATILEKYSCDIDSINGCRIGLDGGTQAEICSGTSCAVRTNVAAGWRDIEAKSYTDCDNNSMLRAEVTVNGGYPDHYTVVHSKFFDATEDILASNEYALMNQYGYSDLNSTESLIYSCPTGQKPDAVQDEQRVYTQGGSIPSICKKDVNQSCSSNSECLYNVCSGSPAKCQLSGSIKGHLYDETFHPQANKTMKLYTCSNVLVATTTTDLYGKYAFYNTPGNYRLKTVAPWGEVGFVWGGESSSCHNYGAGLTHMYAVLYTSAHIEGRAVRPDGFPSVGLNFDASTCSNTILDTDTTNSQGEFDLYTPTGNQKVNVTLNGTRYPIVDAQGNSCVFRAGNVNLGTLEITSDCSLYNNTCSDANPNVRLFNCSQATADGCSCLQQECVAGCTEGAPQCNVVGTGTLKITVSDVNGNAVPYADIMVDGVSRGRTNGYGKKDVNTPHGSHTVRAVCATGSPFVQQSTYLNANQRFINLNLNCPVPPKGDYYVFARTPGGKPAANVFVTVDDEDLTEESPRTDGLGFVYLSDLSYGNHSIKASYLFEDQNIGLEVVRTLDVNQEKGVFTIITPLSNDSNFSSYGGQTISSNIVVPILQNVGGHIFRSTMIALSTRTAQLAPWLSEISALQTTLDHRDMCECWAERGIVGEVPACANFLYNNYTTQAELNTSNKQLLLDSNPDDILACQLESGAFVIGALPVLGDGANLALKNVAKNTLAKKATSEGLEAIYSVSRNGPYWRALGEADSIVYYSGSTFELAYDVGVTAARLNTYSAKGINDVIDIGVGLGSYSSVSHGTEKLTLITNHFGEETLSETFESIGLAASRIDYDPEKITWVKSVIDKSYTFVPESEQIKNMNGLLTEILVIKKKGLINTVDLAGVEIRSPAGNLLTEVDSLQSSIVYEIKTAGNYPGMSAEQIFSKIEQKVQKLNNAKPFLPNGLTFNRIEFQIGARQGEELDEEFEIALNLAMLNNTIDFWEIVDI